VKRICVFILAILFFTQASQGSVNRNESVYVGSVGQSLVAFELTFSRTDDQLSATYFYRTIGRDILLSGSQRGENLTLTETFLGKNREEVSKGTFKLVKNPGRFTYWPTFDTKHKIAGFN
jgi:hypothetical protein